MKFTWDKIALNIQSNYDLFICSASFEDRCLSFLDHCPNQLLGHALICYMKEYDTYISKNLDLMRTLLNNKLINYNESILSHDDPIFSADVLINKLRDLFRVQNIESILVDMTTFTHEMLLIVIRIFHDLFPDKRVSYVYSNAENYDPQTPESEARASSKWLSKGIVEIRSVIGYPGHPQPMYNTHLVIVVGYEYDRALSIISELEPSSLSLAFGKSDSLTTEQSISSKHYGAKEHFDELTAVALACFPEDKFHSFEISCDNPIKTKNEIHTHLNSIGVNSNQNNVMIFALNNKPSTLGVGIFGIEDEKVQLCYAPALIYNYENYSRQGNYCYLFDGDDL